MRAALVALAVVCALPPPAAAQDSTAAVLQRARALYESLELERAVPLLRDVVSPGWSFEVTAAQRVEANIYLGAALMLLGSRDSAVAYFRAALERDPFADLDAGRFTPDQVEAFQSARRGVFALGVRPVTAVRLDPRTARMVFTIVATHAAAVRGEIRLSERAPAVRLFAGDVQGLRDIEWNGVLPNGQLAPSGRYAFVLLGESRMGRGADSSGVYFDVQQEFPPLEDTLADLRPQDLLPERYEKSSATGDLLKGLGVAAGALFLAKVASNRELGRGHTMAAAMGTVGIAVGVTAFVTHRGRLRPDNVAINDRRRGERAAANDLIRRRNAARIAQTMLLITPAAGSGP